MSSKRSWTIWAVGVWLVVGCDTGAQRRGNGASASGSGGAAAYSWKTPTRYHRLSSVPRSALPHKCLLVRWLPMHMQMHPGVRRPAVTVFTSVADVRRAVVAELSRRSEYDRIIKQFDPKDALAPSSQAIAQCRWPQVDWSRHRLALLMLRSATNERLELVRYEPGTGRDVIHIRKRIFCAGTRRESSVPMWLLVPRGTQPIITRVTARPAKPGPCPPLP